MSLPQDKYANKENTLTKSVNIMYLIIILLVNDQNGRLMSSRSQPVRLCHLTNQCQRRRWHCVWPARRQQQSDSECLVRLNSTDCNCVSIRSHSDVKFRKTTKCVLLLQGDLEAFNVQAVLGGFWPEARIELQAEKSTDIIYIEIKMENYSEY